MLKQSVCVLQMGQNSEILKRVPSDIILSIYITKIARGKIVIENLWEEILRSLGSDEKLWDYGKPPWERSITLWPLPSHQSRWQLRLALLIGFEQR